MKSIVLFATVFRIIIIAALLGFTIYSNAQSVAVNTAGDSADASAILDVSSTTKGFLAPRMSTAERIAVVSPATGLLVFDNNTKSFWYFSIEWKEIPNAVLPAQNIWTQKEDSIYTVSSTALVGIGTNTPLEKLDVNGNINMQGNLKISGLNGESGQVLTTNEAGETVWANGNVGNDGYKNVRSLGISSTWVVPDSVTHLMIEAWAGGGGGAVGGGGGSGAYMRRLNLLTAPGTSIQVIIGLGGNGATNNNAIAAAGGSTTIQVFNSNGNMTSTFTVQGGSGANPSGPGPGAVESTPYMNTVFINGSNGEPTIENYYQLNATDFVTTRKFGNGANSAYLNYGGATGGFLAFNTITQATIKWFAPTGATGPGAGGSAGASLFSKGANGLVQIWF